MADKNTATSWQERLKQTSAPSMETVSALNTLGPTSYSSYNNALAQSNMLGTLGTEASKQGLSLPVTGAQASTATSRDSTTGAYKYTPGRTVTAGTSGKSGGTASYTVNSGNQTYVDQLNALYNQIMNRQPFQYDLNGDLLYRQMADQYTQLGQQAMRDTIGQASALTGGYGNSYATTAGNQAYQQYLTQLNNNIPDFYDRALQAWQLQGDELLNQYQLAASHPGYVDAISPKTYTVTNQAEEDEEESGIGSTVNSAYAQALAAILGGASTAAAYTPTQTLYQKMLNEWEKEQTK